MKLSKLFVIALLAGTLSVIGCGSDDSSSGNGNGNGIDPNERCNVELCIGSDELKGNCVREYNSCVDKGGNPENCIVGAVETCTV
jgi:hypothetical protein